MENNQSTSPNKNDELKKPKNLPPIDQSPKPTHSKEKKLLKDKQIQAKAESGMTVINNSSVLKK